MEVELALWLAQVRVCLRAWKFALEQGGDEQVVALGRALLEAMAAAGPGPVGVEDRVAELELAIARTVVAFRSPTGARAEAVTGAVDALRWLDVPAI